MTQLTQFEAWYGRDEPPPEIIKLKAGQLELEFEGMDLRYIRFAGQELIRRIYVAIRDFNWNTIPAKITNLVIEAGEDCFQIQFDAHHQDGSLNFRWHGLIEGAPAGVIEYTMDGTAESEFRYCRMGFCILHPVEGIAGHPYLARTPSGDVTGILPESVEPQRFGPDGFEVPIIPSCSSLAIDTRSGIRVITDFEGDLFEMEDQRNWTDGSFKTYCTPLSLGYPHKAEPNQTFFQKVTVRADLTKVIEKPEPLRDEAAIGLNLGGEMNQRLAKLGFGLSSDADIMDARQLQLLSRLRPAHLKTELHFKDPSWIATLDHAIAIAQHVESKLELALFLTDEPDDALQILKSKLRGVPVVRLIVFHEAEAPVGTTSPKWMRIVRQQLSGAYPQTRFVGGTNGNFAELNRQRPDISVMDGVSYTVNPQVHTSDERTLIEAIEGMGDTVVSARIFCGSLPISISSATLKPPFNQAAIEAEAPQDPNELPANVDKRQMSLFAAAWTVASIRSLAMAGAASITYYETTGWRGLMETANGAPLPDKFRSFPGMVFPVYWVFEFLVGYKDAALIEIKSDRPLLVDGLAFKKDNSTGIMLANLQPCSQDIHLGSLINGKASLKRLNASTMRSASSDPDAFLALSEPITVQSGEVFHTLEPYEVAFLEINP